jgi:prepilin-type processing-associated H-X9-DG protein
MFSGLGLVLAAGLLAWLPAGTGAPESTTLTPDAAVVPADAAVILSVRVADLWTADLTKPIRDKFSKELAAAAADMEKDLGHPPEQIERVTLSVLSFGPGSEVVIVTLTKPFDKDKVIARAGKKTKEEKYKGRTLYVGETGDAVCLLDDRTYVVAKIDPLRGMLDRPGGDKEGPLTAARKAIAQKHSFVLSLNLPMFLSEAGGNLPGEFDPYRPLLEAQTSLLTADAGTESKAELMLTFASDKEAKKAEKAMQEGLGVAKGAIAAGRLALGKEPALLRLLDAAETVVKGTTSQVDGSTLKAVARAKLDPLALATPLAESVYKQRGAAGRAQSQNNLKQLALAMHNYYSTYNRFPAAAIYDGSGKPLLSWRVQILPFIEQDNLYKEFHLNEPWDSEHNKKLLNRMPRTYQAPEGKPTHLTHYLGFHGKNAFFEGKKGITFADITDGTSNTIMFVEAADPVPWTKPEDLPYDPAKPLPKLGGIFEGGFNAAFCDGSVHFITPKVKPETMHLLIQRNDGQVIPNDF